MTPFLFYIRMKRHTQTVVAPIKLLCVHSSLCQSHINFQFKNTRKNIILCLNNSRHPLTAFWHFLFPSHPPCGTECRFALNQHVPHWHLTLMTARQVLWSGWEVMAHFRWLQDAVTEERLGEEERNSLEDIALGKYTHLPSGQWTSTMIHCLYNELP